MNEAINWFLANTYTWTAILAIILGIIRKPVGMNRYANTLRFLFLLYAGIAFAWSGYFHLMLPNFTAAKIGWAPSPFQFEVGLSNLGCAILGFMAFFRKNSYLWLGAILSIGVFTVGAGFGHVYQMLIEHNTAISNSGLIMYTDIIVPIIMLFLWFKADADNDTNKSKEVLPS